MKNKEKQDITDKNEVRFSADNGIYEEAFELELYAGEGYRIYYTTDGSNPIYSETATEYAAPIIITDREDAENVVAAVNPDLFCANYSRYDKKNGLDCYIEPPSKEDVDKCTTIRAVAKNGEEITPVVTRTYFVGAVSEHIDGIEESCAAAEGPLAVISITMNYEDLFDPVSGIYVKGNIFDESVEKEIKSNPQFDAETTRKLPANYNQRGRQWEREAHIEFFEADASGMTSVLNQDCGIRIQGNYSRSDLQKSFRLYARQDYGQKNFEYAIWGDSALGPNGKPIDKHKSFVLRAGGNCAFTAKFNDTYWQSLVSSCACDTKASRPCVVYLNGEYWGLYVLEEDYSDAYFERHYGVNKDDVVLYKGDAETYASGYKLDLGEVPSGEREDYYYKELLDFFRTHENLKDDKDYEEFTRLVDVQSVMDYFAIEVWINNKWDWPGKNWSMWRTVNVDSNNKYADGRWRFSLYDIEFGGVCGGGEASANTIKEDNNKPKGLLDMGTNNPAVLCFAYLMTNDSFNKAYCDRLKGLSSGLLMKERAIAELDRYQQIYGPLYRQFFNRYSGSGSYHEAVNGGYASIKCIREFLEVREQYIDMLIDYCNQ